MRKMRSLFSERFISIKYKINVIISANRIWKWVLFDKNKPIITVPVHKDLLNSMS